MLLVVFNNYSFMKKILFVLSIIVLAFSSSSYAQGHPKINVSLSEVYNSSDQYTLRVAILNLSNQMIGSSSTVEICSNQYAPWSCKNLEVTGINLSEPNPSNIPYCRVAVQVLINGNPVGVYFSTIMSWDQVTTSANPVDIVIQ